jgi:hypothetical protein
MRTCLRHADLHAAPTPPPATCGSTAAARRWTGARDAVLARRGNTETVTDIHNWHLETMMRTEGIRFARDRHAFV